MANPNKPPTGGSKVNVDGGKLVTVTFTNPPSQETTVNRAVVKLEGEAGQGAQTAPRAATAPDVPPVAERCVSPDCMDAVTRVQRTGVDLFKEGGEHAIEVYEKGFEKGRNCCPPPPATPTQTTVQSESSGKWDWVRPVLFVFLGAIIVWLAMNNMKGCNTVVAPAPEQTKSAADPCCPMTPDEVLELQSKTLEMTRKACEGCVSVTRTAPDGEYVDPDLDQRRRSRVTTPPPTQTTYQVGEWKVADENLALRVLDCITRDRRNLRFVGSDSLDGERKEVLLAGAVATLVASGKGVKYVDDAPVVHQASYNAGFRSFCDQVSMMAHGIAKQGKYGNPDKDNTFNYWVNSGVNPFDHNMETDFSVAVDETLEILFKALEKRGYKKFNGVMIATASGSRQRHTSGRGAVASTPSPSPHAHKRMTTIPDGFYMRPTASHKWDDNHWDGKSSAVDMFAAKGTPVYAAVAGQVIRSGHDGGKSGLRVTIRDQYADVLYAHLDKIYVKRGEYVQQGQLIGTVGNTGSAKGGSPHLHFEFYKVRKGVTHSQPWTKWRKVGQKRRT